MSGVLYCDDSPVNGMQDVGEEIAGVDINLFRDDDCNNEGDSLVATLSTDASGGFLFENLPVALSPAPTNPQTCYVLNYDNDNSVFDNCSSPITPPSQEVTIDTNNPDAPPVIFGVMPILLVPANATWALLLLVLGMVFIFYRKQSVKL